MARPRSRGRSPAPASPLWAAADALARKGTRDAARVSIVTEMATLEGLPFRNSVSRLKAGLQSAVDDDLRLQYWLTLASVIAACASKCDIALVQSLVRLAVEDATVGLDFQGPAALLTTCATHCPACIHVQTDVLTPLLALVSARNPNAVQTSGAACAAAVVSAVAASACPSLFECVYVVYVCACAVRAGLESAAATVDALLDSLSCCLDNSAARSHLFAALTHMGSGSAVRVPPIPSKFIRYAALSLREFCAPGRPLADATSAAERCAV
ncbi:MAG: hypothetical protein P4L40_10630, partial [Terracidiphilus sp.]|nr:hypothetical protein [Terracidiphilus sp.]